MQRFVWIRRAVTGERGIGMAGMQALSMLEETDLETGQSWPGSGGHYRAARLVLSVMPAIMPVLPDRARPAPGRAALPLAVTSAQRPGSAHRPIVQNQQIGTRSRGPPSIRDTTHTRQGNRRARVHITLSDCDWSAPARKSLLSWARFADNLSDCPGYGVGSRDWDDGLEARPVPRRRRVESRRGRASASSALRC